MSHQFLGIGFIDLTIEKRRQRWASVHEKRDQRRVGIDAPRLEQGPERCQRLGDTEIGFVRDVTDLDPVEAGVVFQVLGEVERIEAVECERCLGKTLLDVLAELLDDTADVEVEEPAQVVLGRALEIRWRLDRLDGPAVERVCPMI